MKVYAGIGSRGLLQSERDLCAQIAIYLAGLGWVLKTGAAVGADQAFANGALGVGGKVELMLPWPQYEFAWVGMARGEGATTKVLQYHHKDAWDSVDKFHPRSATLAKSVRALHARNWLILEGCKMVIAWPKAKNGGLGGTGQGLRIAQELGITVFRLDEPMDRRKIEQKLSG